MTEPKKEPAPNETKKPRELGDLKPMKDVSGGARKVLGNDKRAPAKTGEIDFMSWD